MISSFLDTSVLVAAFLEAHEGHERSLEILRGCAPRNSFCGAHSLLELYSTLTRMPLRPPILPEHAAMFTGDLKEHLTAVTLTAREYFATIRQAADAELSGGIVYDALLLACARKSGAAVIYTFNIKHFTRVAPDLADRIQAP